MTVDAIQNKLLFRLHFYNITLKNQHNNQIKLRSEMDPPNIEMPQQEYKKYQQVYWKHRAAEARNNIFYRQGLLNFVSFRGKTQKAPKVFVFPLCRDGLETVESKEQLEGLLKTKFKEAYPSASMKCPYLVSETRIPSPMRDEEYKLVALCRICTNQLIYVRNMFTESKFKLVKMVEYHVHGKDKAALEELLRKRYGYARFNLRQGRPKEITPLYLDPQADNTVEDFIQKLPCEITNQSRCRIVCEKFRISPGEYQSIMRNIKSEYNMPFKQLLDRFSSKCYTVRYLPDNLLEVNQPYIRKQKQTEHDFWVHQEKYIKPDIHQIDQLNPDIPNVLLVVSPQMKTLFHQFGHYVGFDLTFSLIKEKPMFEKEYLVGVFAGTSQSRKILIFGLVITSSQSEEVYKWVFKEWLAIMGKGPETLVTDEEQSLFYALRSVKAEGLWKGQHLFDTFHILKKFRKSCQPNIFQLFRKMLHSRDRYDYRRYRREAMESVHSDQELSLLRNFDLNAQMYCYSQVQPSFIGIGISDAINQKYHDLIKAQLPYETNYMRALCVILEVIESRNDQNKFGVFDKAPIEEKMSLPFIKPYRTILSDRIFHFLLREVYKSLAYDLFSKQQQNTYNLGAAKLQQIKPHVFQRDSYIVKAQDKVFRVHLSQAVVLNQNKKRGGKWQCDCQLQTKSGYPCSHMLRVLMYIGQQFMDNIHPRYLLSQDRIEEGLIKFIFRERKYHNFTKVRMRRVAKEREESVANEQEDTQGSITGLHLKSQLGGDSDDDQNFAEFDEDCLTETDILKMSQDE